jgi:hypothetical protein
MRLSEARRLLDSGNFEVVGAAFIATPLFQTSFVPDFTQVNFLPPTVAVVPTFVHFAPALAVANAGAEMREAARIRATNRRVCFTAIRYQAAIPI